MSKDAFINTLFPEAVYKPEVNTKKLALISVGSRFRVSEERLVRVTGMMDCVGYMVA